jgi:uncharacterized SAM-binding protein YcdF (DUF218 family)
MPALSFYQVVKAFALPPACLCLALVIGLLVSLRARRAGLAILTATTVVFYLLCAPFVADGLARTVARIPPLSGTVDLSAAQAIVILSAGASAGGPEYGGVTLDRATLDRLRYGAHLYHRHPLPVLVSGGAQRGVPGTLAGAMKQALEEDFAVPVTWTEDRSTDTIENARFSAPMLKAAGVGTILLVTDATHMPRAAPLFEATGLRVIAAPTGFPGPQEDWPAALIPRIAALERSETAVYELLAGIWHGIRGE